MRNWIAIIFISFGLGACKQDVPKTYPQVKSITESVYASGVIKADRQQNVYAAVNGILQQSFVNKGDTVKRGDLLFVIDNQASQLNTENARLAYQFTIDNKKENSSLLKELEQAVKLSKEKLELDSSLFSRQQSLWRQGVGAKVEYEQRQLAFETSKSNYVAALSRLNQTQKQLEFEAIQARNNLKINQKLEANHMVRSAIDGKIYDINNEQGDFVTTQQPIAVLGKQGEFIIELQVDEYDIVKIKEGQKAKIMMDSYRGETFDAKVSRIYPLMNERSRTFTVEAVFSDPPAKLFPNLTAEANIIIMEKENALIIPREYLYDGKFIYTSPDDKKEVKVGLRDYQYAEIVEGLSKEELVYRPF